MRKIAAAAAAIPYIAYLLLVAAFRRLFPARPADTGRVDARPSDSLPREEWRSQAMKESNAQSSKESKESSAAAYRAPAAASPRGQGSSSIREGGMARRVGEPQRARAMATPSLRPVATADFHDGAAIVDPREAARRRALGAGVLQVLAMCVAVVLLVFGLLVGLPTKKVAGGGGPITFAPIAPQESPSRAQGDLPLDVGFQLQFTKPMNQASVESALTITPEVGLNLQWDATGRTVALVPSPHWDPETNYMVSVGSTATDQQGLGLATEIVAQFKSGPLTSGSLIATDMIGDLASPATPFQLTFTRPVKLITVQTHLTLRAVPVCQPVTAPPPSSTPSSPSTSSKPSAAPSSSPSATPVNSPCAAVNGVVPAAICPTVDGTTPAPIDGACPNLELDIVGDDPSDVSSQVFTATPKNQLASKSSFVASFDVGTGNTAASDAAGAALQPISSLKVTTLSAPAVDKFRPQDGSVTYDTNQPISVRFTTAMETRSTAAAFSVTVNGVAVSGSKSWAEGNTVLILVPRHPFTVGTTVVAKVTSAARAVGGLHLSTTYTSTFKVSKRPAVKISGGGVNTNTKPWYSSEVYYLALMNCTRTGGWVTSSGTCSSVTHHTLPPQNRLRLDAGISNTVARPYARYMADNKLLSHYLRGGTPHSRMCRAGYCGGGWGENIANGGRGMVAIEIFYQNEYWCKCEHYGNIMNRHFSVAGIGVWVSKTSRVAIDFYN